LPVFEALAGRFVEIGPDLFRKACEFGLEGLVSKHRDRPYRGGRHQGEEHDASGDVSGDVSAAGTPKVNSPSTSRTR
jgi:hypothetical protein